MADIEKHHDSDGLQKFPNFVIFKTNDGKVNIDVFFKDETLWLIQRLIAELFEKGRSTITEHLNRIFSEGELDKNVVCRNFRLTSQHGDVEGKTQEKEVKYYNLWDSCKITMLQAKLKAESECEKFRVVQDRLFESDFDRFLKQIEEKKNRNCLRSYIV